MLIAGRFRSHFSVSVTKTEAQYVGVYTLLNQVCYVAAYLETKNACTSMPHAENLTALAISRSPCPFPPFCHLTHPPTTSPSLLFPRLLLAVL